MTKKHLFLRKQKVLPCEIACVKLLCFWWKNTFALKIVDLNFIFSWKRKYYQSNIALNAFCKIDFIFIQTPFIKWVGWATESLGLSYWVTQTEVLSYSGWVTESLSDWTTKSLGLGYSVTWAGLQSSSPVSLGYWVTRTVLLSHSGWATESLSDWATESLGLSYRVTGLGYWVTLRLDYGVTRLGYWVTRTVVSGGYKT